MVVQNIGLVYYQLREYNESTKYLKTAFQHRKSYCLREPAENIKGELYLVLNLLQAERVQEAGEIVGLFEPYFATMTEEKQLTFLEMKTELLMHQQQYGPLANILRLKRKITEAAERKKQQKQTVLSNLVSQYLMTSYTQQLEHQKAQRERLRKDKKMQENKTATISVLWTVSCALFILLLIVIRQIGRNNKNKFQLERERKAIENERMHLKLKIQENSLTDLALEVLHKSEASGEMVQRISSLLKKEDEISKAELKTIIRDVKVNDRQPKVPYEDADAVLQLKEFQQRLRMINPQISRSEMELSTFVRMNLSNKEIAAQKNCTENTIKTAKNRLKKKLGLTAGENLAEFVRGI